MVSPEAKLTSLTFCVKKNDASLIFVVLVVSWNLFSRYEISVEGNILDKSDINLVDFSSYVAMDTLGDRIASCEGLYVVIRSDQLKRIRRFKLPRDAAPIAVIFLDTACG